MSPHDRFRVASDNVRRHVAMCRECSEYSGKVCRLAGALWDDVSTAYVAMIRDCVVWHQRRGRLHDLLRKMDRVMRLLRGRA